MTYRMPHAFYMLRWQSGVAVLGSEHPAVRAAWGRYVGSIGGLVTTASAGLPAHVGCIRVRKPGYLNRGTRRAALRSHSCPTPCGTT